MKAWLATLAALAMAPVAMAHLGPHPEAGIEFEQRLGAALPLSLPFVNGAGGSETLGHAMRGQPLVLVFGYLGCRDLCATTVPGVAEALDRAGLVAGRDYRAVFADIAADEGPAMLAEGPARLPAADRPAWTFLGANDASIRALTAAAGFRYRYEPDRAAYAHPAGFLVVTPAGGVSRYFMGVRFEPAAVREAVGSPAAEKTGSLADRLLLLCYHFDPSTGRYSATILEAFRVAVVAAFLIGLGLVAWRRTGRAR
jgi:protein SCO1/2